MAEELQLKIEEILCGFTTKELREVESFLKLTAEEGELSRLKLVRRISKAVDNEIESKGDQAVKYLQGLEEVIMEISGELSRLRPLASSTMPKPL